MYSCREIGSTLFSINCRLLPISYRARDTLSLQAGCKWIPCLFKIWRITRSRLLVNCAHMILNYWNIILIYLPNNFIIKVCFAYLLNPFHHFGFDFGRCFLQDCNRFTLNTTKVLLALYTFNFLCFSSTSLTVSRWAYLSNLLL